MNQDRPGNKPTKQSAPGVFQISGKGLFLQQDIYEQLKFAYAVNPRWTKKAFAEHGIVITGPADLVTLAEMHNSGLAESGFQGGDGKIYAFNVREVLRKVPITKGLLNRAPIQFDDVVIHDGQVKILK